MINKISLTEIVERSSELKSGLVCVIGDKIYGNEKETFSIVKEMDFVNPSPENILLFEMLEMKNFMKNISSIDEVHLKDNMIYCTNGERIIAFNSLLFMRVKSSNMFIYQSMMNKQPGYTSDNVHENQQFIDIMNKKASDGGGMLKLNQKYILFMYKNQLPINKGDKVSVNIYDIDEYKFLADFTVYKKKNRIIKVRIVYLYI